MKHKCHLTGLRSAAQLAVLSAGAALLSQPAVARQTDAASTNNPAQLPMVTVTAQKEPEPANSTPVSDTAITQATLQDKNITSVREASIYSPNTYMSEFSARALSVPFFRGIGGNTANPGVTTFIDGVPQLHGYSSSIELIDVSQVEFVRGPQGGLFGRNTAGGLIGISSAMPSDTLTGWADGSFGNYSAGEGRAGISGPVVPGTLDLGVSGGYNSRSGYTVDDSNGGHLDGRQTGYGKGQLLFKINDQLDLRLILSGEHDNDGDYAIGDLDYIRANPNHVQRPNGGPDDGFNHRDIATATLLVDYKGDALELHSITGGGWWKNEQSTDWDYGTPFQVPFPGFPSSFMEDNLEEHTQFSQEFRASSPAAKPIKLNDSLDLGWQAGVFLFDEAYHQTDINAPQFGGFGNTSSSLDNDGVGVYGQAKLTAWDKLDFSAGVRYDYEHAKADLTQTIPAFLTTNTKPSSDFNNVSPQFSLAYHVTGDQTAYASVARGYKPGGFNAGAVAGVPGGPPVGYASEHSWNYEVGYKSRWFDGKLEASIALFYIDWRNLQLQQITGQGQIFTSNPGAADSRGVEAEVKYRAMPGLDLFGSVGFDQAKFLTGSVYQDAPVGGNRLPNTPSFNGNMGAQYSWSPCQYATFYARAEVSVYGDFVYDASNAAGQSAYSLADFRAGIRGPHWFAEGWVNNAFDTHYVPIAFAYPLLTNPGNYVGESGAPVTYGVRAGLNF